ncbi:hypothetical protein JCM19055_1880 [Geomicrobium sp. JCM 19055]|nr:hypothetical protein JCM19055_1880 [Geomicrobium sp. JCM 19055]
MGIGSPGGERIPIMLTQVIADWVGGEAGLEQAVETERFHLTEDELVIEGDVDPTNVKHFFKKVIKMFVNLRHRYILDRFKH